MVATPSLNRVVLLLAYAAAASAELKFYTYIGDLSADSALIAWGTTEGRGTNTIGRDSLPLGKAAVRVGDIEITVDGRNWVSVTGLSPDTEYEYQVHIAGQRIGRGVLRTWPAASTKLAFFVIGDFGTGNRPQHRLAKTMVREFERRRNSGNPIRFVLTTGDNIYGDGFTNGRNTGNEDRHWEAKFFRPYERIIASVPWYPSLGNHDGDETESTGDLTTYLDNFFFPSGKPARYYSFSYGGGFAEFFALDSTQNENPARSVSPPFYQAGPQFDWLNRILSASKARWKIPYLHNVFFSAGPNHPPASGELRNFIPLFERVGVRVVFNGHEHNFQYSKSNSQSGRIRFVTTGAGGELASKNVRRNMVEQNIEGWARQRHFCVVEIDDDVMKITPTSYVSMTVVDENGIPLKMPLAVEAR